MILDKICSIIGQLLVTSVLRIRSDICSSFGKMEDNLFFRNSY